MTNAQRIVIALVFVLAVLGGGLLAITLLGSSGRASPSSPPLAEASASAVASEAATPSPTAVPTASPTEPPSPSPSPPPTATARPSTPPGQPATMTFTQLQLDATDDPDGQDRVVTFTSQGAGTITAKLTTLSPQGTSHFCLSTKTKQLGCKSTDAGTLTAKTTAPTVAFTLTLRGDGTFTPIVEVELTFPAKSPVVKIANARFDGTSFPDTNGLQAFVTPRADGNVRLKADWGGHPFLYEVDLIEQGGPGVHTLANQGPSTNADITLAVTAPNPWKLVLTNIETGFGVTPLDATISWP